jgi:hypothetical protein
VEFEDPNKSVSVKVYKDQLLKSEDLQVLPSNVRNVRNAFYSLKYVTIVVLLYAVTVVTLLCAVTVVILL